MWRGSLKVIILRGKVWWNVLAIAELEYDFVKVGKFVFGV
jgi:hypothetical protein